jgi:hypothetical protein
MLEFPAAAALINHSLGLTEYFWQPEQFGPFAETSQ